MRVISHRLNQPVTARLPATDSGELSIIENHPVRIDDGNMMSRRMRVNAGEHGLLHRSGCGHA
jgi:hypothetical protein